LVHVPAQSGSEGCSPEMYTDEVNNARFLDQRHLENDAGFEFTEQVECWVCAEGERQKAATERPQPTRPSVDTTPCRMTGATLHSHVHYKET